jgi:hypothetical protein
VANERRLTDEELEHLHSEALDQLADSVSEYNEAKRMLEAKRPNQELTVQRFNIAKESMRLSLHVYHGLRDESVVSCRRAWQDLLGDGPA